jgi:rubrerythrin
MDEYIDREAAKKMHCDICMEKFVCYREKESCPERRAFDRIPAADVRPVVHGKWIEQEEWTGVEAFGIKEMVVGSWKCSVCGFLVDVSEGDFHYCPNCGADMREEKKQ